MDANADPTQPEPHNGLTRMGEQMTRDEVPKALVKQPDSDMQSALEKTED